ncbi:hypothetical protein BCR32DRAFT_308795 [Anaeromyces robustus]|uniref:Bulb-type lectin domain-containing protein n=1 Tax=Anaeromyces robustus TaxID=1754192 RepID=A0A1Y1UXQ1_9FUNG|nr:hypothetical protein BCR32DRAFT_308795 [Anaeromyces robustus]|eukprot:ORX43101.1 hypothetical protein BCR32DRAFT_308795 [Anaeromyces robustus]
MTANNILADYKVEEDDEYKVDTTQELVIWDSLPKSLPFNVGHYGNVGYTLVIEELNGGSSCQVVLYDGLLSPVWKINPIDLHDDDAYRGYAFPIEYNLPLRFKTEPSNDIHNYIEKIAKNNNSNHPSEITFKCDMKFNENERMISDNGKYSFYLQSSGNLVVKEYERTMWSSNTALLEPFKGPFTLSFSPIDDGELKIIDNYGDTIWSNWFIRKNNYHTLYTEPLVYAISSCNEELRLPYVYNLHNYIQPEHDNIIVDPYYDNLLPGEKLVYQYDDTVYLTLNKTHVIWKLGDYEYTIETCEEINELKLLNSGLKLICKDISKDIATLPKNKDYTLTIKENLRNEDFRIIIIDMETHTIEWAYEPVKRLTSLENKELIYMDKIIVSNTFTTYDKLYSKTEKDKFVYLSNDYGLQLIDKGYLSNVYQMSINETAFVINESIIVNNVNNMKLEYDSKINSLLLSNNIGSYIWKYPGYINCDQLKSNNETCNTIYSLSSINRNDHPWLQLLPNGKLYGSYFLELLDIQHYLNTTDPIYSLKLNNLGDIVINDDKFLHKEYYKSENYYLLELINGNSKDYELINTIKYTNENGTIITNDNINNEITLPLYASKLYINDSFTKGEMLYCNNYSLIILDGKLIYRDHVKLTEEVVFEVPNVNLVELIITNKSIVLMSDTKVQYELTNRLSKSNINTFLSCNFDDNSVYWDDGNGKVLWKYPMNKSYNTKTVAILLYNRYYNKCLYPQTTLNERVTYEECDDSIENKWYLEKID